MKEATAFKQASDYRATFIRCAYIECMFGAAPLMKAAVWAYWQAADGWMEGAIACCLGAALLAGAQKP